MSNSKRNAALAFVGLLALSIYILACTSFSPDDTKVLYPAFDTSSGTTGMAVYNRQTRSSELLFAPATYAAGDTNAQESPCLLRGGWLANGHEIVVAYASPNEEQNPGMVVAVMPWDMRKPVRTFRLAGIKDVGESLVTPLCISGQRLFLQASNHTVLRLDLLSGELVAHECADAKGDVAVYPSPDGTGVFYLEAAEGEGKTLFGRMNPKDFSRTPLMVLSNQLRESEAFAYDKDGKVLVWLSVDEQKASLQVWREGKAAFSRELDLHGHKRTFGNAILAPDGRAVRASFQQPNGTNATSYGLMEIPFSDAPPREVILIKEAPSHDADSVKYFEFGMSHDGKAAAVASTYLALFEKPISPADCALFLVDLSEPEWKVTKVPIAMPAKLTPVIK